MVDSIEAVTSEVMAQIGKFEILSELLVQKLHVLEGALKGRGDSGEFRHAVERIIRYIDDTWGSDTSAMNAYFMALVKRADAFIPPYKEDEIKTDAQHEFERAAHRIYSFGKLIGIIRESSLKELAAVQSASGADIIRIAQVDIEAIDRFMFIFHAGYQSDASHSLGAKVELKDILEGDVKEELRKFLVYMVGFIADRKVEVVMVTEKSARILGVLLNPLLKERGLKVVVGSFVPDLLKKLPAEQAKAHFTKEKRAFANLIPGKIVLVIDEFSQTGLTLKRSKDFFLGLGASNAYTAACYYEPNRQEFTADVEFMPGARTEWHAQPMLLKVKKEASFRAKNLEWNIGYMQRKAAELKKVQLDRLNEYMRTHQE